MRKVTKKSQKAKADKLFSLKVREVGMCELAGLDSIRCSDNLQCMHIIGRSNHNLRWDTMNALCGCSGHHRYYTSHPFEFYELIKREFPKQYEYLQKNKNKFWDKNIEKVLENL
jgi:hypothetical protein